MAGFAEGDLSITVEDRQLVIRGRQTDEDDGRVFLHRGIAGAAVSAHFRAGRWRRSAGAAMENGLLHVDLSKAEPEKIVQTIKIKTA